MDKNLTRHKTLKLISKMRLEYLPASNIAVEKQDLMHIKEKKAVRKVIHSLVLRKKTQWDQTYDPL